MLGHITAKHGGHGPPGYPGVTNHLLQTARSCELPGAECVITGIKPEVAQAMIHIGVDPSRLLTKRDLQDGLRHALTKIGYNLGLQHQQQAGCIERMMASRLLVIGASTMA